jgi:hypothetical protein
MSAEYNKNHLIVAVLMLAGVVVTGLSSNWDKVFPRTELTPRVPPTALLPPVPPDTTSLPAPSPPPAPPLPRRVAPAPSVSPPSSDNPPRVPPTALLPPVSPDTASPPAPSSPPAPPLPRRVTPSPSVSPPSPDSLPRVFPSPSLSPTSPAPPRPRVTAPPPDSPPPHPTPSRDRTAQITFPHDGATVGRKITVAGMLSGLEPEQHVFLCVKSQAFGRFIYPQGQVLPDATGQWAVESIYATPGYNYETFLVRTTDPASVALLNAQHARKYGIQDLPRGTERLGAVVVVIRK